MNISTLTFQVGTKNVVRGTSGEIIGKYKALIRKIRETRRGVVMSGTA